MMALIEWTDSMSVGVPEIDADHKLLISLINQLDESFTDSEVLATLGSVLNVLVDYTVYHFACEEQMLEACQYPKLENHKALHEALTDKLLDIQSRYRIDHEQAIVTELLDFLKAWLSGHILTHDMNYRSYVLNNEAGAKAAQMVRPIRPFCNSDPKQLNEFDWQAISILIVDDNSNFRKLSRTILESVNVAMVREAASAAEALAQLKSYHPHMILCDWRMEDMDGIEFMIELRDKASSPAPNVPVVMMTGYGGLEFQQKATQAGVTRFIEKPITPRMLLDAVFQAANGFA